MPTSTQANITVVISDSQVTYLLERILRSAGYSVTIINEIANSEKAFGATPPDLAIIAEKLSDGSGLDLARRLLDRFPVLPILLFVTQDTTELLKEAMHMGIADYLCLPLQTDALLQAVKNGLQYAERRREWVTLEAKRSTANLQRRLDELETLTLLGRSITASLDLDSVLTAVVDAAVALTGAEEGSLLLLDEATGELYMRAARNFQEDFVRTFRLPVKDSLAGNVIRSGKPIILDEKTPQKIKTAYLVQGLLYVPLQSKGNIFGVLGVDNRQSRLPFTNMHVKALSAMADYAVIAIENARLYATTAVERNKLETILTRIQDGVIVLDPDDRILIVNQTVRDAFHLDGDTLAGMAMSEVFEHQELLDLIGNPDKRSLNHGELTLDDGRIFSVQLTPIPEVGLALTLHDITYLKKLDRIKSDFVSTVSHDLRSPLTAILGYVDLLDRAGPVNDQQHTFIEHIQVSVENITSLVDDLLSLGRIEAGFDTRKEMVPLLRTVYFCVDGFRTRMEEKKQQLTLDIPEELPSLFGNPIQLRQMLDNLVENAVKYTPPGGQIQIQAQVQRNQVILRVSDTGMGIPPVDLPHIFDKFYRASNVPAETPGTGLGLSIVRSIVESHQGRIWVESVSGQGTAFTIVLPISDLES
ncbi:MAG TPA: ATP-binding protein [Anaerolineaceae bacterium]|jgi:two-component system NtrC family sensor kinase